MGVLLGHWGGLWSHVFGLQRDRRYGEWGGWWLKLWWSFVVGGQTMVAREVSAVRYRLQQ